MKRSLIILLCLIGFVWSNIYAEINRFNITFSESDYCISLNQDNHVEIKPLDPIYSYPAPMEPALPFRSVNITVPGKVKKVLSPTSSNRRLLMSQVTVAPTQFPIATDGSNPPKKVTATNYPQVIYPSNGCILASTSTCGGNTMLHFLMTPFVYNTTLRQLSFIDNITLEVDTEEIASPVPLGFAGSEMLKNISYNINDLVIREDDLVSDRARLDYVVITNEALKPHFENLRNWKRRKGLYSEIYTVEYINSLYPGNDLPLKIKTFLKNLFEHLSLTYVLLGGDDTVVPVRGCYGSAMNGIDYDKGEFKYKTDNTIPSDIYYTCFSGEFSWDGNNNGIYGETTDGVELSQSLLLSRLPVRTPTDVSNYTEKLIAYELNPRWTNSILMGGYRLILGSEDDPSDAEIMGELLYSSSIAPYWTGTCKRFYDTGTDFPSGADYDFNKRNFQEQISQGYSYVDIITHGTQISWLMETNEEYAVQNGAALKNIGFSMITTSACDTNAFDSSSKGGKSDPCLSESLIRNVDSGIVGYLGSSRAAWYDWSGLGTSLQYESTFYRNLLSNKEVSKTMGNLTALSKAAFISESSGMNEYRWLQFALNPIGDPELYLYSSAPKTLADVHFYLRDKGVTISTGISNCRICIMSESDLGESYYKVINDVSEATLYDLPEKSNLCIIKPGYLPRMFTVRVIQDEIIRGDEEISADVILIGSNVTTQKPYGKIEFNGESVNINGEYIVIGSDVILKKNVRLLYNN